MQCLQMHNLPFKPIQGKTEAENLTYVLTSVYILTSIGLNKVYLQSWKYGQSKSLYEH